MEGDSGFRWLVAVTPREVQNLLHLPSYGLLSGLWYWTLEPGTKGHWPKMAVAFTISAGLGTGLE